MSPANEKRGKMKRRKVKSHASLLISKPNEWIAKALLHLKLTAEDPRFPDGDEDAYAAFHMEMKKKHKPELPHQFDTVERATQLHWRLRKITAWEANLFDAMRRAVDPQGAHVSAGFKDVLDILFRNNALEKISKYEAKLRDQAKEVDLELRELSIWHVEHGLDRGSIEFAVVDPLDWEDAGSLEASDKPHP